MMYGNCWHWWCCLETSTCGELRNCCSASQRTSRLPQWHLCKISVEAIYKLAGARPRVLWACHEIHMVPQAWWYVKLCRILPMQLCTTRCAKLWWSKIGRSSTKIEKDQNIGFCAGSYPKLEILCRILSPNFGFVPDLVPQLWLCAGSYPPTSDLCRILSPNFGFVPDLIPQLWICAGSYPHQARNTG